MNQSSLKHSQVTSNVDTRTQVLHGNLLSKQNLHFHTRHLNIWHFHGFLTYEFWAWTRDFGLSLVNYVIRIFTRPWGNRVKPKVMSFLLLSTRKYLGNQVEVPRLLGTNWVLNLIWTCLKFGRVGFGDRA